MGMRRGYKAPWLEPTKVAVATDVAWAAGIYEGEGTIAAKPTTRTIKGKTYKGCADYLSVTQKDPEILFRLRDLFGGSVYTYTIKKLGREFSRWTIHGQRARDFARMIYPYLSARRKSQVDQVHATLSYPVETACDAPDANRVKIQSELHGDMQKSAEMTDSPEKA